MMQVLSPGAIPEPEPTTQAEVAWRENLNVRVTCKECREDPPNLYEDHASGDLICASCGLVLQQRTIDQSSEWRTFANDDQGNDDPSRVGDGPNALLNGAQLNTGIAFGDGGMRGKELSRAQNKVTHDKGNKSLSQAYRQIDAFCHGWQLPGQVVNTCKHIYKDAEESRNFKGKSQDALIAGCLFLACRRNNVPRSFREVMDLTKVSKKEIGKVFKTLEKFLQDQSRKEDAEGGAKMTADGRPVQQQSFQPTLNAKPADLCARYCSMLDYDSKATHVAITLAGMLEGTGTLAGRSPLSAASACIYMAGHLMGQGKNPKDITKVIGVSDGTIRHAYKLLYNERNSLVTEELLNRGADPKRLPTPS